VSSRLAVGIACAVVAACSERASPDGGPDCVSPDGTSYVVHGTGIGFEPYENEPLIAVTSTRTADVACTSSVPALVRSGTFAVQIENPWDGLSAYPRYGAYVDTNANERCDDGEPVWTSVRILIDRTVTGELRGDDVGRCAEL
jgi:hypothetical protein